MRIDLSKYRRIVVLTGAGVSAASGIRTYRGPGGLWNEHDVQEYGHVDRLKDRPEQIWKLFGSLRAQVPSVVHNRAHRVLATLEERLRPDQQFLLITQNIDGLHQRAGSRNVVELHGSVHETRCTNAECALEPFHDTLSHTEAVPHCPNCGGVLRPGVVLFGEQIPAMPSWQAKRALRDCDLFLSIGTSGVVEPAASFVRSAKYAGARTIYINLDPMKIRNPEFDEEYLGKSEELLPQLLQIDDASE